MKKEKIFKVKVYLKNGKVIKIRAKTFEVDMTDGNISGYSYTGSRKGLFAVSCSEIAAIIE